MARKSRLSDTPDWIVAAAKTTAAVVRPGAALTAAAAAGAGVVLESVSKALEHGMPKDRAGGQLQLQYG